MNDTTETNKEIIATPFGGIHQSEPIVQKANNKLLLLFAALFFLVISSVGGIFGYRQYILKNSQPVDINQVDFDSSGGFYQVHGRPTCGGITKNKPEPIVGDTVTFTCDNGNDYYHVYYQFRYSLNSGAWNKLTNATDTTANLVINSCGTYSVQCRICAPKERLPASALEDVCEPIWTGATTP